jgi:hypothetical protein
MVGVEKTYLIQPSLSKVNQMIMKQSEYQKSSINFYKMGDANKLEDSNTLSNFLISS